MKLRILATLFLAALVGGVFSTAALADDDPDYYDRGRIAGSELIDRGTEDPDYYDPARMTGSELVDRGTEDPDYYDRNSEDGNDR